MSFEELYKWAEDNWDFLKTRGVGPSEAASIILYYLNTQDKQ